MRFKKEYNLCKVIDLISDINRKNRMPHQMFRKLVVLLFPKAKNVTKGVSAFKTVYKITEKLVVNYGDHKHIMNDKKAYNRIPQKIRNRHFAKIYWHTKYTYLQKLGHDIKMPKEKIKRDKRFLKLKRLEKKYNIRDVRPDNVKLFGKRTFKIIDANPK